MLTQVAYLAKYTVNSFIPLFVFGKAVKKTQHKKKQVAKLRLDNLSFLGTF